MHICRWPKPTYICRSRGDHRS